MATTYEPITTQTLSSSAPSVTFATITGTYTDLVLVAVARTDRADYDDIMGLQFNGDTGTNYSTTIVNGNGSAAGSSRQSTVAYITSRVASASATAGIWTPVIFNIQNYSNTTTYKSTLCRFSEPPSGGTDLGVGATAGLWRSTAAITSIVIKPIVGTNLISGSTFTLYGIKAA
jgi:hypothetical protein